MSWLNRIQNQQFEIITGDGSIFYPIWKTTSKSRELNATKFEFSNVEGSLVKRGKVSSQVIPFEFWFQGEDHLEQSELFNEATKDIRAWTLKHTYYDELLVQPATINFNNSNQNITIVTGEFWETLPDYLQESTIDLKENVLESIDELEENISENYDNQLGTVEAGSLSTISNTLSNISNTLREAAITADDIEAIETAISEAYSAFNNISEDANVFLIKMASLARTPARFYSNIKTRLFVIQSNYDDLKLAVTGLISRQNKLLFENFASILLGAMAETAVLTTQDIADEQGIENNEIQDYLTRLEVLDVIDTIELNINDFFETLEDFQTVDGSTPDSFIPDIDTIRGINDTAKKAIARLNEIAIGAKQQRVYTLPEDLPVIVLVHRLYGTINNQTVDSFIEDNNISYNELLILKKDREVVYYI